MEPVRYYEGPLFSKFAWVSIRVRVRVMDWNLQTVDLWNSGPESIKLAVSFLVLHGVPAQAPSTQQPWLYATQSQNTAVQCGLEPATQISSTPNFIVG